MQKTFGQIWESETLSFGHSPFEPPWSSLHQRYRPPSEHHHDALKQLHHELPTMSIREQCGTFVFITCTQSSHACLRNVQENFLNPLPPIISTHFVSQYTSCWKFDYADTWHECNDYGKQLLYYTLHFGRRFPEQRHCEVIQETFEHVPTILKALQVQIRQA